ncbi:hypothetical protein DXG01_006116 [Tephrocybe rancida]|nr:hypothetical protein DXG01_006116 [Tephrocybe rancida]
MHGAANPLCLQFTQIPTTPRANRSVTRNATYPEINGQSSLGPMSKHPLPQAPLKATPAIMPLHTRHLPLQTAPASQDSFRRPKNHRSDMYPRSQLTYSISFEPKPGYNVQQHTPPDPDAHPSTSTSHHRPPPPNLDAYTRTSPPDPRLHTPRRPIEIYVLTPPPRGPQRSQSYNDTPTRYNNTSSNNNHTSSRDSSPSRRTRFIFDIPHHTPPSPPSRRTPPLNTHPNECPITPTSMHRKSTTTSTQTRTSPSHRPPTPPSLILPLNSNPLYPSSPPLLPSARADSSTRGDHINEGYIVYVPPDLSFPQELDGYPERDYQDDLGFRIATLQAKTDIPVTWR